MNSARHANSRAPTSDRADGNGDDAAITPSRTVRVSFVCASDAYPVTCPNRKRQVMGDVLIPSRSRRVITASSSPTGRPDNTMFVVRTFLCVLLIGYNFHSITAAPRPWRPSRIDGKIGKLR